MARTKTAGYGSNQYRSKPPTAAEIQMQEKAAAQRAAQQAAIRAAVTEFDPGTDERSFKELVGLLSGARDELREAEADVREQMERLYRKAGAPPRDARELTDAAVAAVTDPVDPDWSLEGPVISGAVPYPDRHTRFSAEFRAAAAGSDWDACNARLTAAAVNYRRVADHYKQVAVQRHRDERRASE